MHKHTQGYENVPTSCLFTMNALNSWPGCSVDQRRSTRCSSGGAVPAHASTHSSNACARSTRSKSEDFSTKNTSPGEQHFKVPIAQTASCTNQATVHSEGCDSTNAGRCTTHTPKTCGQYAHKKARTTHIACGNRHSRRQPQRVTLTTSTSWTHGAELQSLLAGLAWTF